MVKKVHKTYPEARRTALRWTKKGYQNVSIRTGRSGRLLGKQIVTARKPSKLRRIRDSENFFDDDIEYKPRRYPIRRRAIRRYQRPVNYSAPQYRRPPRRTGPSLFDRAGRFLEKSRKEKMQRLQKEQDERLRRKEDEKEINEKMRLERIEAERKENEARIQKEREETARELHKQELRRQQMQEERRQHAEKMRADLGIQRSEPEPRPKPKITAAEIQQARTQYIED